MILEISSLKGIYNLTPTNTQDEIAQNINIILSTIKGTVPLDRNFGIDISFIDNPTPSAFMKAKIVIAEAIKEHEQRVEVLSIKINVDESDFKSGDFGIKVKVRILDEYK